MRKKLIAGNWKMNTNIQDATDLTYQILEKIGEKHLFSEILICPPFTNLYAVNEILKNTNISIGAQNCEYRTSGAFTGEISVDMLSNVGCSYVIIGHSERRQFYNETDELVNLKIKSVIYAGLTPILCIGETLDERNSGDTFKVLSRQLSIAFQNIDIRDLTKIIIAYEPVWAIGTGISATNEQAGEAHTWIREFLRSNYGYEAAEIRILYGGSMNDKNAFDLLSLKDVDGGLIGGASLKADSFYSIIESSESTHKI